MRTLTVCLAALAHLHLAHGSHAHKHKHAELGIGESREGTDCDALDRRKNTLKLIKETPFVGLFHDLRNHSKFEASGLSMVDGKYYVVFDNSMSLGLLDDGFHFRGDNNKLIGEEGDVDSEFEGIAYVPENDTFLLLQEATVDHGDHYHPHILTVKLHKDLDAYDILQECYIDFELSHNNKGLESIQYVVNKAGAWLLGLCEGNLCVGGSQGKDPGQGRIVVSQLENYENGTCKWATKWVIEVPEHAYFTDYSAMAFRNGKLAILSQVDAAVWIGEFDMEALEFKSRGQVFHFPRDNHCEIIYCNLEGIQWIDDRRVVVTSDKAKRYQPFYCDAKDQTVHIFSLPGTFDPFRDPPREEGEQVGAADA